MKNGIVIGTIACVVAIILIGSALAPIINITTTTTTAVDNDGAVGLRMDKVSSGDFTINYGLVGDDFTATNGTDTQVIDDLCIFYADDNVSVWMDDNSIIMLGKDASNNTIDEKLSDESTITITKSSAGLEITDGTITQIFPVPTWSYVPRSTGSYGFFLNETEINTGGLDVHYVGSYAGVSCYDSINSYDLPITLDAAITGSTLTGAKWIKAGSAADAEITPFEPGSITIQPLDPGVISLDPEPDASIMTVPTPAYTDGDWGYNLITSGTNQGKAKIVSYSGAGGGSITVPATIGGYDVAEFGSDVRNETVFDASLSATDLIFSYGINKINSYALIYCTGFTGSLVIPDSVTSIGNFAFYGCTGFTGSLVIPDSVTSIGSGSFINCTGFTKSLVIKSEVIVNGDSAFNGCSNLTSMVSMMNQGSSALTNSFGNNNNIAKLLKLGDFNVEYGCGLRSNIEYRSDIIAVGYLAPAELKETVTDDSPMAALLQVIPLITIIAVVMMAVGVFIAHRME